jgi:hypothetical protein
VASTPARRPRWILGRGRPALRGIAAALVLACLGWVTTALGAAQTPQPAATPVVTATPIAADTAARPQRPAAQPWLNVRQQDLLDLDGDGPPDALRIEGNWGPGLRTDVVTVYADQGNLPAVPDYTEALDFDRTTWVFDPQGQGRATIIIRFARENGNAAAYLWDDQDGDRQVAYELDGRALRITESPHWTVKVWADGDWLREDGTLNANLHGLMEGCGSCSAGGAEFPAAVQRTMAIDGRPDYAFDMIDADDDGIPEYRTRTILAPISDSSYSLPFFLIQANEGRVRPAFPERYLFWPLVTDRPAEDSNTRYFDLAPYLPVDWRRSDAFLPTLPGYPIEHGYHINSHSRPEPGEDPIYLNFENPMAYYDIAGDRDGNPELHVRMEYNGAFDPDLLRGQSAVAQQDVRYSWNQANHRGMRWDFKFNLSGRHQVEAIARLGPLNLQMIPFDEFPSWVTDQSWDMATFIAVEGDLTYTGSEGIYEWPVNITATRPYFGGLSPLRPEFPPLPPGLRGEFSERPGPPAMYLDPVDGKLHQLRLEGGSWNLGGGREVRYVNLDGGDHIDGWQLWDHGSLTGQLYRAPGGLLFGDAAGTWFRAVSLPEQLGQSLPPTDGASRDALADLIAAHPIAVASDDLRGLFDRFPGPAVPVATGPPDDIRLTAAGLTFAVAADDRTRAALAALTGERPGGNPVVVARGGDGWSVVSGSVEFPAIAIEFDPPRALSQLPLRVKVTAPGSLDLGPAVVEVTSVEPDGEEVAIGERELVFDEKGVFADTLTWQPLVAGQQEVIARIRRPVGTASGGEPVELAREVRVVDVEPAPRLSPLDAAQLNWKGGAPAQAMVVAGFALLAAGVGGVVLTAGRGGS